jgi:hypothetical protein
MSSSGEDSFINRRMRPACILHEQHAGVFDAPGLGLLEVHLVVGSNRTEFIR